MDIRRGLRGVLSRARRWGFAFVLAGAWLAQPAWAQSGVVHLYVGAAPGGPVELYARIIGDYMAKTLGQPVIVDVRPGANGNVAGQIVFDAPADGLSVWVATQSMLEINPLVYPGLRWSAADFTPLLKGVEAPLAFVVNPELPARTFPEFLAYAKQNVGKLAVTSYSPGTPGHFLGVQLNERFGLDLAQVPYKGSAPQVTDLLGGYAKIGFTQTAPVLPHVAAGALRVLATTGATRFGPLPDAPTFTELGYPDFLAAVWYGLVVRATTPAPVAARLLAAAKAAHADAQVRAALAPLGLDVVAVEGEPFARSVAEGTEHWRRLVAATGFKATD